MVSKASDDLPEPDKPVMTTSWSRGISRSRPLRLCSRAPRMTIRSLAISAYCVSVPACRQPCDPPRPRDVLRLTLLRSREDRDEPGRGCGHEGGMAGDRVEGAGGRGPAGERGHERE